MTLPAYNLTQIEFLDRLGPLLEFRGDYTCPAIDVARIFDWGNHKSHAMTSSEIFKKELFVGKDIVEWKISSRRLLALSQDFGKGKGEN